MTKKTEFQRGYDKGRRDEAEVALRNLYIILDQMNEKPHESNHIIASIRDLEKVTGKKKKDFEDEEDAFKA